MNDSSQVIKEIEKAYFKSPDEKDKKLDNLFILFSKIMFGLSIALCILSFGSAAVAAGVVKKGTPQGLVILRSCVLIISTILYIPILGIGIYYAILSAKKRNKFNVLINFVFVMDVIVSVLLVGATICNIIALAFGYIKSYQTFLTIPQTILNGFIFLGSAPLIGLTKGFGLQKKIFDMSNI